MKRSFLLPVTALFFLLWSTTLAQTGVTAEAIIRANLRATTSTDAPLLGEITAGTAYPVIGRSALYPWYLLADSVTLQPKGWVFAELVTVRGDVNNVPFSDVVVNNNTAVVVSTATMQPGLPTPTPNIVTTPTPMVVAASGVMGTIQGEVNIRYGPGTQYPRVGVGQAGQIFEVTAYHTQFPWVQIRFPQSPGGLAWVAQDLLVIQGDIFTLPAINDSLSNLPTLTPTPAVISGSIRPNETEVPLSPEFALLGNRLWQIMLDARFDLATNRFGAFFVMDLQTGEAFSVGSDIAFSGTSVNKIAILARLYGSLAAPPNGDLATDIANTMICSENAATNRLLNQIGNGDEFGGAEEVTRFLNAMGFTHSFITYPYQVDPAKPPVPTRPIPIPITGANQSKANPDLSNQLTVDEMGWLLANIYECGYGEGGALLQLFPGQFEPRECRQMLHVMSNNNVDALLKAGVPAETRVAHKHGWIADTHSNAAVFFTPGGNYVIVMMMFQPTWLNFEESLPIIAEVSRNVYNYYNPEAPMLEIREGFIPEAPDCNFAGTPLITDLRQPVWNQ